MWTPVLHGRIRRRFLVNFRVDPEVAQRLLPSPLRPQLVAGSALAGVCLIRLEEIGPRWWPRALGLASENAAHRVAVVASDGPAVYIPRRDTSSLVNRLAGGRLFPGAHHGARFTVLDDGERVALTMSSSDGEVAIRLRAHRADRLPAGSAFPSLAEASAFFQRGSTGYSTSAVATRLDGIRLATDDWRVEPLAVDEIDSSFFADPRRFPPGSVAFDSALVMRDVAHEWHSIAPLAVAASDLVVDDPR